jgi:NADH:ubiquinone oxidoreductase subunit E
MARKKVGIEWIQTAVNHRLHVLRTLHRSKDLRLGRACIKLCLDTSCMVFGSGRKHCWDGNL